MNAFVELPTASLIEKMSNEEYHSRPEFSSSQLKDMLRSSAHFYSNNILKEIERETSAAMIFGTLVHTIFLEPEQFENEFVIAPKFDRRTKAGKEEALAWEQANEGKILVDAEQVDNAKRIAQNLKQLSSYADMQNNYGMAEASIFFTDPEFGLQLRIRPDYHIAPCRAFPFGWIGDLKTTTDARPHAFSKKCADFGYDLSAAMYREGFQQYYGTEEKPPFVLLTAESSIPFNVKQYKASDLFLSVGETRYRRSKELLAESLLINEWDGYAPELLMGLRSVEEEQDRIIDVTPDQSLSEQADFNQIKREILGAKSPAALDEAEGKAMMMTDDTKREELLKLIGAQAKKFQPEKAVNVQNSTSNDVAEKTVDAKKPEPVAEQAAPAVKKPTSAEVKKDYLVRMNKAESRAELNQLHSQFTINDALTGPHLAYLKDAYTQAKEKFNTPAAEPAQQEVQTAPAVNEIKSNGVMNGLKLSIEKAENLEALNIVAQTIRESKPSLTVDHMSEVLQVYGARKTFLENQQDMFADVPDVTWTDKAIADIAAAKNQDEINFIFTDPQYEEQSDPDQQRITNAAQKRESELFGN